MTWRSVYVPRKRWPHTLMPGWRMRPKTPPESRALGDIARAKGRIAELESRNGTLIPAKEVFGKFEWNASFDYKAERSRK